MRFWNTSQRISRSQDSLFVAKNCARSALCWPLIPKLVNFVDLLSQKNLRCFSFRNYVIFYRQVGTGVAVHSRSKRLSKYRDVVLKKVYQLVPKTHRKSSVNKRPILAQENHMSYGEARGSPWRSILN